MKVNRKILLLCSKKFGYELSKKLIEKFPETTFTILHPNDLADERSVYSKFTTLSGTNVEVLFVETKKAANDYLMCCDYDLCLVCGWYWIIPDYILENQKAPLWGIHHSLLPAYRGGSPLVWAMLNGDKQLGSSLFCISRGADSGPIIEQIIFRRSPNTKILEVLDYFEDAWVKKTPEILFTYFKNGVVTKEQDCQSATYCAQRSPQDGKINWSQKAINIMHFVNAQSFPYPGAFTFIEQQKIIIESVSIFPNRFFVTPGQVIRLNEQILVGCGNFSAIVIEKMRGSENIREVFKPGYRLK